MDEPQENARKPIALAAKIGIPVLVAIIGVAIYLASRVDYPDVIRIGDGSPGGRYASLNKALEPHLNKVLKEKFGSRVERVHTQGSLENLQKVESGELHLAFCQEGVGAAAQVNSVINLENEYLYVVVKDDSPITRVADLQGKQINPGTKGSGTYILSHQIFEYYPLTDFQETNLGFTEVLEQFDAGKLDAAFFVSGFKSPALLQMLRTGNFRVLPVPFVPAMWLTHPWINELTLPAMAFKRLPNPIPAEDIPTLGVKSSIIAGKDIPPAIVEAVVAAILETSFVQETELVLLRNNQATGFAYTDTQYQIHEGAQAYYYPWQPTIPSDFVESWNGIIGIIVLVGSGVYTVISYFRQKKDEQLAQLEEGKKNTLDEYVRQIEEVVERVAPADSSEDLAALRAELSAINRQASIDYREERFRSSEDFTAFTVQLSFAMEQIQGRGQEIGGHQG